ncbi:hypothetical protein [Corynebacterium sp.]|uniref:hypothetical protein n=1 Tax=Corynebacterium sp. TaxID=1720 RepID=UPI0025BFCC87|nr:hypothetical protein [Corynebacterium sp.]
MSVRITAQQRRSKNGKPCIFEPSAVTVRPWYPGRAGEEPGVLLVRGRIQHRLTIAESYQLIDAIADTAEQFDREETAMNEAYESRPYYTSEGKYD